MAVLIMDGKDYIPTIGSGEDTCVWQTNKLIETGIITIIGKQKCIKCILNRN